MRKTRTTLLIAAAPVGFFFLMLFTLLALLGENDRVDNRAFELLTSVKKQHYPEAYECLSRELQQTTYADKEHFYETCFFLELALQDHYHLLDADEGYAIKVHKRHLWTPFMGDQTIKVRIVLSRQGEEDRAELATDEGQRAWIDDLFSIVREGGVWKVGSINIQGSDIADLFDRYRNQMRLDQYIQQTSGGFALAPIKVTPGTLSPIERRQLAFVIQRVTRLLEAENDAREAVQ